MARISLPLRLTTLPALAAMIVVIIGAVSILDLEGKRKEGEVKEEDSDTLQVLMRPRKEGSVPRSSALSQLTEEEALRQLEDDPGRAAILRLWPLPEHRERLFSLLLRKNTSPEVRLYLLGRFEAEAPEKALAAARSIAKEKDLSQGPLLLSIYEILSRLGEREDLALLTDPEFELEQTKSFRKECRARLEGRVEGRN